MPYNCLPICGNSYKQRGALTRHQKDCHHWKQRRSQAADLQRQKTINRANTQAVSSFTICRIRFELLSALQRGFNL
jgi:hypothetical protein